MCVKLPPRDLNLGPYPPHPTSMYTCGVTTTPRVCDGEFEGDLRIEIGQLCNCLMITGNLIL